MDWVDRLFPDLEQDGQFGFGGGSGVLRDSDTTFDSSDYSSTGEESDEEADFEVLRARSNAAVGTLAIAIPRRVDGNGIALREHLYVMSESFGIRGVEYKFVPTNVDQNEDVFEGFVRFLETVYAMIRREFHPNDYVQVNIFSNDLTDRRIGSPFARVRDADLAPLLDNLEAIIQSNHAVSLDSGDFTVEVLHVTMPESRGYEHQRKHIVNLMNCHLERVMKETRSLYEVDPDMDPFCAAVSLLAAKYYHDCKTNILPIRMERKFHASLRLRRQCRNIHRRCHLPLDAGVRLEDFEKLARLEEFVDYEIKIFTCKPHLTLALHVNELGRKGPLYLYLDGRWHLYVIKSVNALFGKTGALCSQCNKFFSGRSKSHTCDRFLCKNCKCKCDSFTDVNAVATIHCDKCDRFFYSTDCYALHARRGASRLYPLNSSVCSRVVACKTCGRDLKAKNHVRTNKNAYEKGGKDSVHECFKRRCRTCGKNVDFDHKCHIFPLDPWRPKYQDFIKKKRGTLWFFDVECCNEERVCSDGVKRNFYVSNLVVLQKEDGTERHWKGEGCMSEFCKFVFFDPDGCLASDSQKHTLFAHNASGFDSVIILKECVDTLCEDPKVIFDSGRPIKITVGSVTVLDSCRFFQTALAKLPKAFGLRDVEKGHFPHNFNVFANEDYSGPLPDKSHFSPEFMQESAHQKFESWWEEENRRIETGERGPWVLQDELLKYCRDDVRILREAWLKFEKLVHEITGFLPGICNVSIASLTNLIFKSKLSSGYQIGIIPTNNYVKKHNSSKIALEYLTWLDNFYYGGELKMANKGTEGEHCVYIHGKRLFVDGYHPSTKTAFEFLGCFFHGCPKCTLPDSKCAVNNKTNRDLFLEVQFRCGLLTRAGYTIELMWECEWRRLRCTSEIARQLEEIGEELVDAFVEPIKPRDALYGGRTECIKLQHEASLEKGEKIKAYDFNSLYPDVMVEFEYPTGHPFIFQNPRDKTPGRFFGLMKCKILPPRGVYLPLLPTRIQVGKSGEHKLMFVLCRTCAESQNNVSWCSHSDDERCLTGTWATPEVYRAMEEGYVLKKIYWVWDYRCRSDKLFSDFVKTFYKLKTEASGYPSSVVTEEDKVLYRQRFFEKEGVELDDANIRHDPVLRFIMKMFLNSCWGKWAQNPIKKQTTITHAYSEFLKWVSSDRIKDKEFKLLNPECILLAGKDDSRTVTSNTNGSVVHACFVLAYGRLKLHLDAKKLGADLMYMDTDSMFFVSRKGREAAGMEPQIGRYLGELTSVFDGDDVHGLKFVGLGPKNYAYTTDDGKCVCKVRGITFNRSSSLSVNFDLMNKIVDESVRINTAGTEEEKDELCKSGLVSTIVPVERFTIVRGDRSHVFNLSPRIVTRNFRGVFDKRVILFDKECITIPYGF